MRKQRITSADLLRAIKQKSSSTLIPNPVLPVTNQIILDDFEFEGSNTAIFNDCIFVGTFTIYGNEFYNDFTFKRCYFVKGVHLIDVKTSNLILLMDCKVRVNIVISGCKINRLATYGTYIEHILIGTSTVTKLELGGKFQSYIKRASVLDDNSIDKIQISNCQIEEISFNYLSDNTEIFNCNINSLHFNKVRNNGNLKLLNCKSLSLKNKMSHFISNESNLGKAEFFQFDFSSFDEVNIINSVLNDCLFINTIWSDNIKGFSGDQMDNYFKDRQLYNKPFTRAIYKFIKSEPMLFYKENKQQLNDKREVYKQIKYALSKQGDTINEHLFHRLEMNTYNKSLDFKNVKNWGTKTILYLSSLTSNYGQSLRRPFFGLIFINALLYFLMVSIFNYEGYEISVNHISWSSTTNAFAEFIRLVNPLHRNEPELRGWLLIIDIIIRIWSSYMIYNLVRASRRFIK